MGSVIARRLVMAVSASLCAVIVVLASLSTGPSSEASVARDNTYFSRDLIARAGDLVSARALPQRATMDHAARVARVAAPAVAVPGSEIGAEAKLTNTGLATWTAGGARPVRLSYHWLDEHGRTVEWDGARTGLTSDVPPGRCVTAVARVRGPSAEGTYILAWDRVQDGTGWFSSAISSANTDVVVVQSGGVTFYGKGWGHGSGLSQWGAQGWAQGAAGVRLNGEEIALRYFPGAALGTQPPSKPFRVP